jgi:hypothetical protein
MQKNRNFKGKNLTSFAKLTTLSKKMMWHHAIKVAKNTTKHLQQDFYVFLAKKNSSESSG